MFSSAKLKQQTKDSSHSEKNELSVKKLKTTTNVLPSAAKQQRKEVFYMKMYNGKLLYDIVDTLLAAEVRECFADLGFGNNAITFLAMEDSHTMFTKLSLLKNGVDEIHVKTPVPIKLRAPDLLKSIKCANKSYNVSLTLDDPEADKLLCETESDGDCKIKKRFYMNLISVEMLRFKIDGQHAFQLTMSAKSLSEIIQECCTISDDISIIAEYPNTIKFIFGSSEIGNGDIMLQSGRDKVHIKFDKDIAKCDSFEQVYASKYLKKLINVHNLANNVTIGLDPRKPMKLEFDIEKDTTSENKVNIAHLEYYISYRNPEEESFSVNKGTDKNKDEDNADNDDDRVEIKKDNTNNNDDESINKCDMVDEDCY